jgi:hypothetical protein
MSGVMDPVLSFVAASLLAAADLAVLALATRRLGAQPNQAQTALLALGLILKLALLFAGCVWMARQPWFDRRAMLAGLAAPFLLFIAWQALRLQLRNGKRT